MRKPKDYHKYNLYLTAFQNSVQKYAENPDLNSRKDYIKRAVLYGVKAVNAKERPKYITMESAEDNFQFISIINSMIGLLTPKDFMEIFPITKDFKGHKWGLKITSIPGII